MKYLLNIINFNQVIVFVLLSKPFQIVYNMNMIINYQSIGGIYARELLHPPLQKCATSSFYFDSYKRIF